MIVRPTTNEPNFGILKGHRKTSYGSYMWGLYKGQKVEIYNATKYKQKLQYLSDVTTFEWIKSKLTYIQDGTKKILRSEAKK